MVPLSKSGVRKHRGFESRPLRHSLVGLTTLDASAPALRPRASSDALAVVPGRFHSRIRHPNDRGWSVGRDRPDIVPSGRGRLVDYGAALEMRFGATHRGFESRPLRHARTTSGRPVSITPITQTVRARIPASSTHTSARQLLRRRCATSDRVPERQPRVVRIHAQLVSAIGYLSRRTSAWGPPAGNSLDLVRTRTAAHTRGPGSPPRAAHAARAGRPAPHAPPTLGAPPSTPAILPEPC